MATTPRIVTVTNVASDVLNAIRNNASTDYRDYVPVATEDSEVLRGIGNVLMDNPALRNEFINSLVNRIGKVIISSKTYENPWSMFKKGILDYGETIEEVFIDLINPQQFNVEKAETELYKREMPNVKTAFHVINYKEFYKVTIEDRQLRTAFLSSENLSYFINNITSRIYTSANYDEYQVMKYLLARCVYDGKIKPVQVTNLTTDLVEQVKAVSNDWTFMNDSYNLAGVKTFTEKNDQYILIDTKVDAKLDVNVLASAFNMDKVEFMGHRVLMDGLGNLDIARLNTLFANDETYHEFSVSEMGDLSSVPIIMIDKNFLMILDNLVELNTVMNGQGLYYNLNYHTWKTFSISPFNQACLFNYLQPMVLNVSVTPSTSTLAKGGSIALSTTVETVGFAPQTVTYVSSSEDVTVNSAGVVKVIGDTDDSATITVTSTYDTSKTAICTITIDK